MSRPQRPRLVVSLILLAVLAACSGGDPGAAPSGDQEPSGTTTVAIAGFRFDPDRVEVAAGSTVRWENEDEILHTVTQGTPDEPGGSILDGTLDGKGTSYETAPGDPGEYPYFCSRHTSMTGTLIVS